MLPKKTRLESTGIFMVYSDSCIYKSSHRTKLHGVSNQSGGGISGREFVALWRRYSGHAKSKKNFPRFSILDVSNTCMCVPSEGFIADVWPATRIPRMRSRAEPIPKQRSDPAFALMSSGGALTSDQHQKSGIFVSMVEIVV